MSDKIERATGPDHKTKKEISDLHEQITGLSIEDLSHVEKNKELLTKLTKMFKNIDNKIKLLEKEFPDSFDVKALRTKFNDLYGDLSKGKKLILDDSTFAINALVKNEINAAGVTTIEKQNLSEIKNDETRRIAQGLSNVSYVKEAQNPTAPTVILFNHIHYNEAFGNNPEDLEKIGITPSQANVRKGINELGNMGINTILPEGYISSQEPYTDFEYNAISDILKENSNAIDIGEFDSPNSITNGMQTSDFHKRMTTDNIQLSLNIQNAITNKGVKAVGVTLGLGHEAENGLPMSQLLAARGINVVVVNTGEVNKEYALEVFKKRLEEVKSSK